MVYSSDSPAEPAKRGNGFAVTALVLGIIALVLAFVPVVNIVSFALGVVAIVFGIVGLVTARSRRTGRGMSITGLVLGVLALAVAILMYVLVYNAVDDKCKEEGYSGDLRECVEDLDTELTGMPHGR
jgi:membrane-bound ClpP family serine protease